MADDPMPVFSVEDRSLSIPEFCIAEGISKPLYHKMRNKGFGPDEMRVPGSSMVRVSPEARRRWHEKLEKFDKGPEGKKTRKWLAKRASAGGKAAVLSPLHVRTGKRRAKKVA